MDRNGSSGSMIDSAIRGSRSRLRNFCRLVLCVIRMCAPCQSNHIGLDCGPPSGRTVATCAYNGFSNRSI